MKKYNSHILTLMLTFFVGSVSAQTINWANLKQDSRHIVNLNFGIENGTVYGVAYAYHFKTKLFPVLAGVEASIPAGNKVLDDYKSKVGGQVRWIAYHHFQFSTRLQGVFRRYQNDFVRLVNFGSDFSGTVGYYGSKSFFSGEVGFDKAIVTKFKHSKAYMDQFPSAADGWYEPTTGGNFYYGLQGGISFKKADLYLRAGKMLSQDFKTSPTVPFYGQLGYTMKF